VDSKNIVEVLYSLQKPFLKKLADPINETRQKLNLDLLGFTISSDFELFLFKEPLSKLVPILVRQAFLL
jgi:hypothetical protein